MVRDEGGGGLLGAPPPPGGGGGGGGVAGERVGTSSRFDRTKIKTERARRLRRDATDVERRLWQKLRGAQIDDASFRRQHPAGNYVLDFYCPALQLAIELDGGQHAQNSNRDGARDEWLAQRGVTV